MEATSQKRRLARHASGLASVVLGGWLALGPWIFRIADTPRRTNDFVVGAAIAAVGFASLGARQLLLVNVGLGAWLVVSAFVLGHRGPSLVNHLVVGLLVVFSALPTVLLKGPRRPIRPVVP